MTTQHLDKIFSPRSIAVIGASDRAGSVANMVARNLGEGGFRGNIYPVNPKHEFVGERPCFDFVTEIPEPVDLAIVCTPASTVPGVVKQCGEANVGGMIIVSAGFRETGVAGAALEREVSMAAKSYPGMRIIGPNCFGVLSPHKRLNAGFAGEMAPAGNVAFISQSGALCTAILDWATSENVGFSQFVSIGNMIDVTIADLIDYFGEDANTKAIIFYVESLTEARSFLSAARAFTRSKPIIAYKAGRYMESAEAAASHTGAMAGVDSVYEAAFARAGIVRVMQIEDLFDCAEFLARHPSACGDRLAIVSNAGGPGVMATDALLDQTGKIASLSEKTIATLNAKLPASWSHRNPVDVIGDATPERFAHAVRAVLRDPGVDALLVILSPQAMTDPTGVADAVINAVKLTSKPVLASWMGGKRVAEGIERLTSAGIPTYSTPGKCVRTFMHLVRYDRNSQMLYETPHEVPLTFELHRDERQAFLTDRVRNILTEYESKRLLGAYGIPVTPTEIARTRDAAVATADRMGYPVVLKVFSPEITHKTDVQGVELNLAGPDQVAQAYDSIIKRAKSHRPDAVIDGVTVQPMVIEPFSRELIVGAKRDPVFGPVLMVGAGGVTAELYRDRALELPPLNERLARRMLESLQSWPLLEGYRGRRGVNVQRLIECLLRVSTMIVECPEIAELDINPLLATDRDVIALDARVILRAKTHPESISRFKHLAIRPYPDELVRLTELPDRTSVLLRPIMPEDEPIWHRLIESCSPETIHMRFRHMFKRTTHAMASRFCFVDYDRELAIVAEVIENGAKQLAGVGRLIADADHQQAEFAILVADRWQGRGLGAMLMDECLEICKSWNIPTIVAETAPNNRRMIQMFQRRGFEVDRRRSPDAVFVTKNLTVT